MRGLAVDESSFGRGGYRIVLVELDRLELRFELRDHLRVRPAATTDVVSDSSDGIADDFFSDHPDYASTVQIAVPDPIQDAVSNADYVETVKVSIAIAVQVTVEIAV